MNNNGKVDFNKFSSLFTYSKELQLQKEEKDQEVLGVTTVSFTPIGAVAGGKASEIATGAPPVVEEKMALMLLLVLLLFLRLYCSHNRNTRKEK